MAANPTVKIILAFILLFAFYHLAEYMIMFNNSVAGFFVFQILFFVAAWLLGNWYNKQGFKCWGLPFSKGVLRNILFGIMVGILLYAVPFVISLAIGVEKIVSIPNFSKLIAASLPFIFGVIFSSFSEDVLTRGLVYRFLNKKISTLLLIFISASIYLLNHIYRLGDGLDTLLYLFLLGINFVIPLINTKNLWFTGSMHWAGNSFFFVTHGVIQTESGTGFISANYIFSLWLLVAIPIVWYVSKSEFLHTSEKKPDNFRL